MDGTLVDSLGVWDILWERMGQKFLNHVGFRPTDQDDKTVRTMLLFDAMAFIHQKYGIAKTADELYSFADNFIESYYKETVGLKDGVLELLEQLRASGVKMCIASATAPHLIGLALVHCGLDKYFDKAISCAEVGCGKDKPDVFVKALEYLGSSLDSTWVFEDSSVAIKTSADYGFKTVGVYDRYNYGQDEIAKTATIYVAQGEKISKVIQ